MKEHLKKHAFNKETASEAGKKSKRPVSLKRALKEMFQKQLKEGGKITEENFVKACALSGMKGNAGMAKIIFEYIDGKVPQDVNTRDKTLEENPLYNQLKEMTKKHKEK